MQAAFNDNWIKMTGEVLNGTDYFPSLQRVGDTDAHLFVSSPAGGSESMHLMYLMAIAAAEHSIDLAASYFVPDELIVKALLAARDRGVKVRILLPGKHIDSETVRIASKAEWGPLLLAGIEVHEYQPTMVHVKHAGGGQANWCRWGRPISTSARSGSTTRPASTSTTAAFAERMTAVFEQDLKLTTPYTYEMWKDRPWKDKFAEKVLLPIKSQL